MKRLSVFFTLLLSSIGILKAQNPAVGAWKSVSGEVNSVLLITPEWFSITDYKEKSFLSSYGGTWKDAGNGESSVTIYFNTANPSQAGQSANVPVSMENGRLITSTPGGSKQEWTRVDDGTGALAGNWQITSRQTDGKMNPIPSGPRQTFRIMTGTRFQWVALNLDTGEFFGSGGGTYTFENGTYTEKIEFFSRDNSRVGAMLSFKGTVNGNNWDHSGLSSKGDPIHEIWSRNSR
ncbi:MAG: hypothetical protein J7623_31260 [Chitinophaga sp.]|uniref:hypothetical protein n=1 Tax=Chitinophaga sp. TaxID=1869181 RepID=UPI001B03BB7B|nr:hypothetical protein [Chitinophaga sp.]MBO9733162.1 hypothetical protein [Chitinophaga sp.]